MGFKEEWHQPLVRETVYLPDEEGFVFPRDLLHYPLGNLAQVMEDSLELHRFFFISEARGHNARQKAHFNHGVEVAGLAQQIPTLGSEDLSLLVLSFELFCGREDEPR